MLLLRPLTHYADFQGRSHRGEYLLFMTAQAVLAGNAAVLSIRLAMSGTLDTAHVLPVLLSVALVSGAALLVPNLALQARRLHDSNRSAVWLVLASPSLIAPIMLIGWGIKLLEQVTAGDVPEATLLASLGQMGTAGLIGFIGLICNMILFGLMLVPGSVGPNRYGPDPRDEGLNARSGSDVFDDANLDALIEAARRDARVTDRTVRPDFGQGMDAKHPSGPEPAISGSPHRSAFGVVSTPGFGRRGA